jgi:hypothetical protein
LLFQLVHQSRGYVHAHLFADRARVCSGARGDLCGRQLGGTGYTAAMQIKAYALSSTVLYDAGAANDIALGGTAGTITLTIPAADTEGFTWWNGVYDLVITDSYGVATRVLEGQVTVSPGVTP